MTSKVRRQTPRKKGRPRKPHSNRQSVRDAIRAVVDARFDSLLTDVGDVLGYNAGTHPFKFTELEAVYRREHRLQPHDEVESQLNFLIGVEVGRRIGGAR